MIRTDHLSCLFIYVFVFFTFYLIVTIADTFIFQMSKVNIFPFPNTHGCVALQRSAGAAGSLSSHPDSSVDPGVCGHSSERHPENSRQSFAIQGLETPHQLYCLT